MFKKPTNMEIDDSHSLTCTQFLHFDWPIVTELVIFSKRGQNIATNSSRDNPATYINSRCFEINSVWGTNLHNVKAPRNTRIGVACTLKLSSRHAVYYVVDFLQGSMGT